MMEKILACIQFIVVSLTHFATLLARIVNQLFMNNQTRINAPNHRTTNQCTKS
jgi:hypothetical protein